jgi:hypothetical protein
MGEYFVLFNIQCGRGTNLQVHGQYFKEGFGRGDIMRSCSVLHLGQSTSTPTILFWQQRWIFRKSETVDIVVTGTWVVGVEDERGFVMSDVLVGWAGEFFGWSAVSPLENQARGSRCH